MARDFTNMRRGRGDLGTDVSGGGGGSTCSDSIAGGGCSEVDEAGRCSPYGGFGGPPGKPCAGLFLTSDTVPTPSLGSRRVHGCVQPVECGAL